MKLTREQLYAMKEYAECHSNPVSQADTMNLFDTITDLQSQLALREAVCYRAAAEHRMCRWHDCGEYWLKCTCGWTGPLHKEENDERDTKEHTQHLLTLTSADADRALREYGLRERQDEFRDTVVMCTTFSLEETKILIKGRATDLERQLAENAGK